MADDADKTETPATKRSRPFQNEWTASDERGPLGAAEAGDGDSPALPEAPAPHTSAQTPEAGSDHVPTGAEPPGAGPTEPEATAPHQAEPPEAEPTYAAMPRPSDSSPADPQPERRHVPVLPIIAALVVGAVIGAASAAVVYKTGDPGASQGDVNALASRLDALEKRPDPQPELDGLKASLAKVSATKPAPAATAYDPGPLQQKITGLVAEVDALRKQTADRSLGDKVAALGGDVSSLKAQAADVKGLDQKVAALAAAIDGLKKEDQSAQAGIASLQSGQKSLEGKTGAPALAVATDSLVVAIAQGRPYAGQVDALAALGADPTRIAVLRENADKGVPSARVLAAKFAPLADPIIATASQAPPNASLGDRLKSGLFGLVSVRRSDATEGDDVPSRVSRIEADLAHDDVAGAYETWSGLPAAAKAKSDAWGALAKTQVEAMTAARGLQAQAIAGLGGKKS